MSDLTSYYSDDAVRLYKGDCTVLLPEFKEQAGMLLTDPPYGLDIGYGRTALGLRRIAGDADAGLLQWVSGQAYRLLAEQGWAAIFCGYSQVGGVQAALRLAGLDVKTVVVWDKQQPSLGMGIRNQHELCVLARKGMPPERWTGGNVWRFPRDREGGARPEHPHQKPVSILHRLIDNYSEPGSLVLDPFAGSGSTLRAAKDCGRTAVGFEVEQNYCDLIVRRMAQEVLDLEAA